MKRIVAILLVLLLSANVFAESICSRNNNCTITGKWDFSRVTIGGIQYGPGTNCNFVFDGDSITAGTGASSVGTTDWPSRAMTMSWFTGHGTKYNTAVGGSTAADAVARYNATVHPLSPAVTGKCGYYFVGSGHNDLSNGGAPGSPENNVPQTGAATAGYLETLWSTAKADGFKVVATTIKRASVLTGAKESERIALNKLIRTSTTWDFMVPMDAVLTDPTDTTYMTGDGVHPNDGGYLIYAHYVNQVMLAGGSFFAGQEVNPFSSIISAGDPAVGLVAGDMSASRNTTQGLLKLGSDGNIYIFRNASVVTLKAAGFGATADGSSPSGLGSGDISAQRSATQGLLWLGSDSNVSLFRNGNVLTVKAVGLSVAPDNTAPASLAVGDLAASRGTTTGDLWLGTDSNVRLMRASTTVTNITNTDFNASPASTSSSSGWKKVSSDTFGTTTNCSSSGGTCSSAAAGSVSIAAAGTTVTVATTAVTANSQIFVQEDSSLGTKLGVTCNTTTGRDYTVTARTAATSFVITSSAAPSTNPACLSFFIVN